MKKITLIVILVFLIFNGNAQNALNFDGINDYVDAGNSSSVQITGSVITLEAWIYPTVWESNVWQGNVINKEDDSNNSGYMLRCGAGGKLNFNLGNGSWNELTSTTAVLTLNTWQHIAGTYDGTTMTIYVDGVVVGTKTVTMTISNTNNTQNLMIGNWSYTTSNRGFTGAIDDARIWSIYRSQSDIQSSMNNEFCSSMSGLIAYYKLNEGVASGVNTGVITASDFTANANDGTLSGFSLSGSTSNWTAGTVAGADSSVDVISLCDLTTYTWTDGLVYTSDNSTATQTLQNSYGCDSIVTLNLSFNTSSSGTDVQIGCIGSVFTWIDNVDYLTDNSTATHTITTVSGCDSIVTLNLTFSNNSTTGIDVQSTCAGNTFNWIDGVDYLTDNSTATHTLMNVAGCDSVVTLNLTFLDNSTGTDVQTACDSYTWINGTVYTSSNTTATHTLTSANGCDSIVTLNLTINTVDSTVITTDPTITANQVGATYKWLNCESSFTEIAGEVGQSFTASENGEFAVEITNNGCVDTSACITIATVSLQESDFDSNTKLYPNPTNGSVTLSFGAAIELENIVIEDISGKKIKSIKGWTADVIMIDLSELTNGIYFVKINSEGRNKVIKLVKE